MKFADLHAWPDSPAATRALQTELAPRVRLRPMRRVPRLIAGIDVAFSPGGSHAIAGVVLWNAAASTVIESRVARRRCTFRYVPGLLSFRELPVVLDALRQLDATPDVVLCDAQGIAHPRGLGLASHLGLWINVPTVGCAKSRLCGTFDEPGLRKSDASPLVLGEEQVGVVLRTRDRVRPLFVSPGHLCDVESGRRLTLECVTRYRLPEPTRLAHQLVTRERTVRP
ncbi:MAG: deoxyribonuclease V [Phycisphaerae bacterium]